MSGHAVGFLEPAIIAARDAALTVTLTGRVIRCWASGTITKSTPGLRRRAFKPFVRRFKLHKAGKRYGVPTIERPSERTRAVNAPDLIEAAHILAEFGDAPPIQARLRRAPCRRCRRWTRHCLTSLIRSYL